MSGLPSMSFIVFSMRGGVLFFAVSCHSLLLFFPSGSVAVAFIVCVPGVVGV